MARSDWQWDNRKTEWDVQHPDGSHTNVGEDGNITHGDDNFPQQPQNNFSPANESMPWWVYGGLAIVAIAAAPETGGTSLVLLGA